MNALQLWFFILIAGAVLVVAYTMAIKALVNDPNTTPWLSYNTWLILHFIAGLFLGILLPNPAIQMAAFIIVWELLEKIFGNPFPQYFAEPTKKALYDIFITTGRYVLGQWLRSYYGIVTLV